MAEAVYGSGIFRTTEQKATYRMARIQVLTLSSQEQNGYTNYPFALVIDQVEHESINSAEGGVIAEVSTEFFDKESIVKATGATGVIVANGTLDVA